MVKHAGPFWDFVAARQEVFWLRTQGVKPPWTADPVLASTHFTNVYRELDPGTQYAIDHILNADAPADERFFNLMFYRLVGRVETHQAIGWLRPEANDIWRAMGVMLKIREDGQPPFTGAYMVNSYAAMAARDKVLNVGRLLLNVVAWWDSHWAVLSDSARTREQVLDSLSRIYGWGEFLAYQVVVDASYPLPDPWVSAEAAFSGAGSLLGAGRGNGGTVWYGPGAVRGARRAGSVEELASHATAELAARDFAWMADRAGNTMPLTPANLANCLCEFDKYCRYQAGEKAGRVFEPVAAYRRDRDVRGHGQQFQLWQGGDAVNPTEV